VGATYAGLIEGIPPETLVAAAAGFGVLALILLIAVLALWLKRRRSERGAAAARGHLRTVTATMREGVIAYDMRLRLTFVNPAFERLTGYPEEDLRDQEFPNTSTPTTGLRWRRSGSAWRRAARCGTRSTG
jgi:PAS domain-containing protein